MYSMYVYIPYVGRLLDWQTETDSHLIDLPEVSGFLYSNTSYWSLNTHTKHTEIYSMTTIELAQYVTVTWNTMM